jgi:hypothetical protein
MIKAWHATKKGVQNMHVLRQCGEKIVANMFSTACIMHFVGKNAAN